MRNKNVLKVFGIMFLLTFVLTWVIPATTIQSSGLVTGVTEPTGIADIFTSIDVILVYFAKPAILMLFIGMFYGVVNKSGALKALVDEIVSIFKKHSTIFLGITILFYAVTTAFTGIYFPMFMFIPLSVAVLLGLKYNKVQALLATVGSTIIGLTGEISNYVIKIMTNEDGNKFFYVKLGLLVVLVVLEILYIVKTSKKNKKDDDSGKEEIMFIPEKRVAKKEKNPKGIALFVVLVLLFVVFVLGLTPWSSNKIFSDCYTAIKNVKIGEFQVFDAILGTFETFGEWTYTSLYPTIGLAIIVMALVNSLSLEEASDGALTGLKKIFGISLLTAVMNVVVIFTLNSGFVATIINVIAKSGNIALITLSSLLTSPFMVESAYASQYILQMIYKLTSNDALLSLYGLVVQFTYGFTMLIAPSSILLMIGLCYTEEKYTKWVKYIWKLLLAVLVACLLAVTIAAML